MLCLTRSPLLASFGGRHVGMRYFTILKQMNAANLSDKSYISSIGTVRDDL